MPRESKYQRHVILRLRIEFPGSVILKNDSGYLQGIPDLTILLGPRWAMLEVKESEEAPQQPNQAYYIDYLGDMSYASFIYPENEEVVFRELQQALQPGGPSRHTEP